MERKIKEIPWRNSNIDLRRKKCIFEQQILQMVVWSENVF